MQSGLLKKMAFLLLRISALPFLLREFVQRRRVTILVYHKLSPVMADAHFAALRRKYNIVSLADYSDFRTDSTKKLPPKALIVTLDDGHKGNYALKPVLEKYRIRPTIFLCSGLVGTNRHFWFETEMAGSTRQELKRVGDSERLDVLEKFGFSEQKEYPSRQALSASEIQDMRSVVDFQSHTVLHPILPQSSGVRAFREISDSKAQLEERFGFSINALAYPNGDYSEREIESAKKSGYQYALTLDLGFNTRSTPAFQLKRICINDDAGLDELLVKASGLWGFLRQGLRVGSRAKSSARGLLGEHDRPRCQDVPDEN